MNEQKRYENIDTPFYRERVAPVLPPELLDFHTHIWTYDQWITGKGIKDIQADTYKDSASISTFKSAKYMATELEYRVEQLLFDGERMFPCKAYHAVFFGQPTPAIDMNLTNGYVAKNGNRQGLYPLIITGKARIPKEVLREQIIESGFFGYKVFLDWIGDDYRDLGIEDMIGSEEMELANELGLVVLLHVPRSGRLADPEIQRGVREYAKRYPNASIVLAHCGRCYQPYEMKSAIGAIRDLNNVFLDTAMVMDPLVIEMVFDNIDSSRVLFATDLPIAAMRGRRVNVMDHWVDVVLEGYPKSAYRVPSNDIRTTFMVYEIILAINAAGEMAGLKPEEIKKVFYENGMALLGKVMRGQQLEKKKKTDK